MIEVLKQALEALEFFSDTSNSAMDKAMSEDAITSLRQAIAELESQKQGEPVACKECHLKDTVYDLLGDLKVANLKLSVRSQRTWVGLTDEERSQLVTLHHGWNEYAQAIEAKLKEKNNA